MMESLPTTRRLAAIVIADIVGYTRLMERDDARTFAALGAIRSEVIDPAIVAHGGRIVQTAGDGWLAEFPSALAALRSSIQIQREMAARNARVPADERLDYRIGVNLGDIIVQGMEIAGDGVNVASRLESLAEPGAICISSAVREQVHGQLDAELVDIGEQQVKNIQRPIRVYRVQVGRTPPRRDVRPASNRRRVAWRNALLAVTVVGVAAAVPLVVKMRERAAEASAPPALSVAILPFAAAAGSPAEQQFANALTADLTTTLAQWRWARVAAHGLVNDYAGKAVDARTLGRDLNVGYVVEGDVRKSADDYVVTTRMIDAATGTQAWSDSLKFASGTQASPIPHLQMTKRLRAGLLAAEIKRANERGSGARPMDLVLRGRAILQSEQETSKSIARARALFSDALRVQPEFVPALFGMMQTYDTELEETAAPDRATILPELDRLTSRMIGIDGRDDSAWRARAIVLQWLGRFDEAMFADERAQVLDPSSTSVLLDRAWILIQTGRSADALPLIDQAIAMDPLEQSWPFHFLCKADLFLGRYAEAVTACEKAATENDWWLNQVYLSAAYAQHGDLDKSVTSKNAILQQQPGYTIDRYRRTYAAASPLFLEQVERHLVPGLRKAGLPEQ